jgi:glycosyltransferase involved in cell wall biosynthesis
VTAPLRAAKRSLRPSRDEQPALTEHGRIEWPPGGSDRPRAPVDIHGWALFPGSTVARVEVRLNGGPPELARLAVERPASAPDAPHPDAPLCGFEHKVDLASLPSEAATVTVEATAHALDGRRLVLHPVRYTLTPADRAPLDPHGDLADLRRRSRPPARPRRRGTGLRLLAFSHSLERAGGSLYLLELLRRLGRRPDVRCELVAPDDGPLREAFESEGIAVHLTDGHRLGDPARYESHIAELLAWCELREFDAVLVNTLGAFAGADVASRLGLPAVWAVHESFPLPMYWFNAYGPGQLHPYVRSRAEEALRGSAAVLFVADATRALFSGDADPHRLVTLPYGVEPPPSLDRAATRRKLGIDAGARVVLCLGTVEPRKGQALLAQAFAQVAGRHPDVQLALVGATGDEWCADYRAALDDYLARSGLAGRVRIEPETADPWSWHAVADLVVCASDIESLPRSLTEAMAFGTPVLSTRVFGVPELIDDGLNGFLCGPRDVAELALGLDRVLAMPADELAAVARAGRERVRARHDPDLSAGQVLQLLHRLARDPEERPSRNGVPISSPP